MAALTETTDAAASTDTIYTLSPGDTLTGTVRRDLFEDVNGQRTLITPGDEDWIRIVPTEDTGAVVLVEARGPDGEISLYGITGAVAPGTGGSAPVVARAQTGRPYPNDLSGEEAPADHYLRIWGNPSANGDEYTYTLSYITETPEISYIYSENRWVFPEALPDLEPDSPVSGTFEYEGDGDSYLFSVAAGQNHVLRVESGTDIGWGASVHAVLENRVEFVNGTRIYDYEGGDNSATFQIFSETATEAWVRLTGFDQGGYTLTLRAFPDDAPASSTTQLAIAEGETLSSSGDFAGDVDWVRVTLAPGQRYVLHRDAGNGVWFQPDLRHPEAADNSVYFDNRQGLLQSSETEEIDVFVRVVSNGEGAYQLRLEAVDEFPGITYAGGAGVDVVYGSPRGDMLQGGAGNDLLGGGPGNDTLEGGDGDDALFGAADDDVLSGGNGDDTLGGFTGDDSLSGGAGDDALWGAAGNDTLSGGTGNDTLGGAAGNDSLNGGSDADELWGSLGEDTLNGGTGNDVVGGGTGNDVVDGDEGDDEVFGGLGNDVVSGGSGNDQLFGAAGDDTLTGGAGDDTIYGGPGADVFVFGAGDGADQIGFFSATDDRLQLDDALWSGTLTTLDVVTQFGSVQGNDYVLDFGGGDRIILQDRAALTGLDGLIDIV